MKRTPEKLIQIMHRRNSKLLDSKSHSHRKSNSFTVKTPLVNRVHVHPRSKVRDPCFIHFLEVLKFPRCPKYCCKCTHHPCPISLTSTVQKVSRSFITPRSPSVRFMLQFILKSGLPAGRRDILALCDIVEFGTLLELDR